MYPRTYFLSFLCFLLSYGAQAQSSGNEGLPKRMVNTVAINNDALQFDGALDDYVWKNVTWTSDFTEYQPAENTAPSYPTSFAILYDTRYLYVGFRCHDPHPDSIVQRMARRDEFPGDWVEINIDSYHDLRTAFSFTTSVSGVRGDEFISDNGGNWDTSWNPVWDARTRVDSLGWTAEIKIPFSQLRYGKQQAPVWGIQVQRLIFRKQERSCFQYIPQNAGAWVSNFGELHGLRNLPDYKQVEIAPYALGKVVLDKKEEGNPFADGSQAGFSAGVDGKIGITRDLMLDFTINPDFGQVEADPGAIRLDGYEVFFQERRPFFVESRNLFDYQVTGSAAGGNYDSDLLFYSRRIGGAPHRFPNLETGEYVRQPERTAILGAAKFSGKTANGWSIGLLETVTSRERALIHKNGEERRELVEPLTNFVVGRVMKDFDKGNTIFGAVFTGVNREKAFEELHRSAYSGGLDFQHFWKNRWWTIKANVIASRVAGDAAAIYETQTGFVHLFQRSNATHLKVDPTRTSLTGTGGTFKIAKYGGQPDSLGGVFKFESGVTWRSPELELNDIGFLLAADEINHFSWGSYNIQQPFWKLLNLRVNYNHFLRWDFSGRLLSLLWNTNAHAWLKNNWRVGTGFNYTPYDLSNNALRGGSTLRLPNLINNWAYISTDTRKKIAFDIQSYWARGLGDVLRSIEFSGGVTMQPVNAMQIGVYPGYGRTWRKGDQYVAKVNTATGESIIVSEVIQQNFSLTTRFSYNLSPTFTVQFYGQPFLFRANYAHYGMVNDPLSKNFEGRFTQFPEQGVVESNGRVQVDQDGDGIYELNFSKPDFNFVQFRGNLVLRWEYIPGSELYLVWTQNQLPNAFGDLDTPVIRSLFNNAFNEQAQHIFLIKATYRFLR
jgi:hypothetical protein